MDDTRPGLQRFRALWVAAAAAAAILPLAVLAPLGEVGVAALVAVPLLGSLLTAGPPGLLARMRSDPLAWLLAALLAWAAAASLWSPNPPDGLGMALRIAALTAGGLGLLTAMRRIGAPDRQLLLDALALGFVIGCALLAVELLLQLPLNRALHHVPAGTVYPATHLDRAITVMVILSWPVARHLRRRCGRIAALAAYAVVFVLPFLSLSRASMLAVLLSVPTALLVLRSPRQLGNAAVAGVVAGTLLLPIALAELWQHQWLLPGTDLSELHFSRLGIWDYALDLFLRRPLGGWGMDASRYIGPDTVIVSPFRRLDLHPHNAFLNIALELGIPGVAIVLAGLVLVMRRVVAITGAGERAAAAGLAVAILVVFAVSYGVWQYWWHAAVWLAVAFLVAAWPRDATAGD